MPPRVPLGQGAIGVAAALAGADDVLAVAGAGEDPPPLQAAISMTVAAAKANDERVRIQ